MAAAENAAAFNWQTRRCNAGYVPPRWRLQFVRLPEGLHLVSGSSDQTVKFWPLASLEAAAGTPNR